MSTAQFKCWRKESDTKYTNKKRKGTLHIGKSLFSGKPDVTIKIDTIKIGRGLFPKTHIYEEFESKAKALRYVKSYMKKEDEC